MSESEVEEGSRLLGVTSARATPTARAAPREAPRAPAAASMGGNDDLITQGMRLIRGTQSAWDGSEFTEGSLWLTFAILVLFESVLMGCMMLDPVVCSNIRNISGMPKPETDEHFPVYVETLCRDSILINFQVRKERC
jgi:hypothetical protein